MKKSFLFNQVTIIGVGLIGGSLGMAIKKKKLAKKVIGFSRRKSTLKCALKLKAVDKATLNLKQAVKDSDLIILAAPPKTIIKLAKKIVKLVKKDCILTDVGSSKAEIVSSIERKLPRNIKFVGAHPLAGSEKKGVAFACPELFKNSLCIFTPTSRTNAAVLRKIKKLWLSLGADIKSMKPSQHDKILAFISHLPHIVSFGLIQSIPDKFLKFAPQGLKDMTRIASSDAVIWRDIFLSNKKELLVTIDKFQNSLRALKRSIRSNDASKLEKILSSIKNKRDNLTQNLP